MQNGLIDMTRAELQALEQELVARISQDWDQQDQDQLAEDWELLECVRLVLGGVAA